MVCASLMLLVGLACGRPSVGVGVGIPGTPVSVGTSVPVGPPESAAKRTAWRTVRFESVPDQAEIYVRNQLVGSTPAEVQVPFEKGLWGGAKGSSVVLLKKAGYAPEGVTLFPGPAGSVARQAEGPAFRTLRVELRAAH